MCSKPRGQLRKWEPIIPQAQPANLTDGTEKHFLQVGLTLARTRPSLSPRFQVVHTQHFTKVRARLPKKMSFEVNLNSLNWHLLLLLFYFISNRSLRST